MNWVHLVFGLLLFFIFTTTGSYMRADFPDKDAIPQELRVLMRSRHIYILFSALIHLALGAYMRMGPKLGDKILQYAGSALLLLSSGYLVWAFVVETYSLQHFSNLSRYGIYTSLAGVALHVLGDSAHPVRADDVEIWVEDQQKAGRHEVEALVQRQGMLEVRRMLRADALDHLEALVAWVEPVIGIRRRVLSDDPVDLRLFAVQCIGQRPVEPQMRGIVKRHCADGDRRFWRCRGVHAGVMAGSLGGAHFS